MDNYDVKNWFWIVASDETKLYSSKVGDYVAATDAAYVAWKLAGNAPTRIASADDLAEVLANSSVRPVNADVLDRFKNNQADKLTIADLAKVIFAMYNDIRVLKGKQPLPANQFKAALKAML